MGNYVFWESLPGMVRASSMALGQMQKAVGELCDERFQDFIRNHWLVAHKPEIYESLQFIYLAIGCWVGIYASVPPGCSCL